MTKAGVRGNSQREDVEEEVGGGRRSTQGKRLHTERASSTQMEDTGHRRFYVLTDGRQSMPLFCNYYHAI
jgi:hypothetical protein